LEEEEASTSGAGTSASTDRDPEDEDIEAKYGFDDYDGEFGTSCSRTYFAPTPTYLSSMLATPCLNSRQFD
jgi:hypothetical protein